MSAPASPWACAAVALLCMTPSPPVVQLRPDPPAWLRLPARLPGCACAPACLQVGLSLYSVGFSGVASCLEQGLVAMTGVLLFSQVLKR